MLEKLHEQVNLLLVLAIYEPGPDLWSIKFGPAIIFYKNIGIYCVLEYELLHSRLTDSHQVKDKRDAHIVTA